MSTTRHHINRERRRQSRDTRPAASPEQQQPKQPGQAEQSEQPAHRTRTVTAVRPRSARTAVGAPDVPRDRKTDGPPPAAGEARDRASDGSTPAAGEAPRPHHRTALAVLCALTLLLGGFAGWAHAKAESLRDDPALRNTALTDLARTSEIKGQAAKAVDRLFSYDHTDPGALRKAAEDLLTGKAVARHRALLADVRKRADAQKAVITTTVTDSAVERIDGDRARVLVYADQSSVSTSGTRGKQDEGVYAGAMLAVDVVLRDGRWLVSGIDTFGR
ncbi:hypothetical protein [Streptomyces lavenduligriseus]|uniref:Mce-associated membrane protein n=1 Tax=Streptomyces lavenduligriseus TaxID=67315 RepID=A0ABT0P003_9ACTN|nr:hypothetical protein [Streptomyces lavenduligriseus]MCL3997054.1 hypothetical protein [Streptomyces lavenduligriseus]